MFEFEKRRRHVANERDVQRESIETMFDGIYLFEPDGNIRIQVRLMNPGIMMMIIIIPALSFFENFFIVSLFADNKEALKFWTIPF